MQAAIAEGPFWQDLSLSEIHWKQNCITLVKSKLNSSIKKSQQKKCPLSTVVQQNAQTSNSSSSIFYKLYCQLLNCTCQKKMHLWSFSIDECFMFHFLNKFFALFCTMLKKILKCEVKAWLCWKLIILPPLRFYVKSNFGKFKWSKNVIFSNFGDSEFWYIWDLKSAQIY